VEGDIKTIATLLEQLVCGIREDYNPRCKNRKSIKNAWHMPGGDVIVWILILLIC
jgi:hypothetical protein